MGTTLSLGVIEPDQGTSPWDATANSNFLILNNNVFVLIGEMTTAQTSIASILSHQATDEANITAAQNAINILNAQAKPVWTTYVVSVSGSNWLVNGTVVAALSTTNYIQQIPLFTTAAGTIFTGIALKTTTAFNGDLPSCVASLGTAGIPDALMSTTGDFYDMKATVTNQNFYVAGGAKVLDFGTISVVLNVVVSGLNKFPANLTTGVVHVSFLTSVLP